MPEVRKRIYLDHAATAHRRPPEVREAMVSFLDRTAANPEDPLVPMHRIRRLAEDPAGALEEALGAKDAGTPG